MFHMQFVPRIFTLYQSLSHRGRIVTALSSRFLACWTLRCLASLSTYRNPKCGVQSQCMSHMQFVHRGFLHNATEVLSTSSARSKIDLALLNSFWVSSQEAYRIQLLTLILFLWQYASNSFRFLPWCSFNSSKSAKRCVGALRGAS
jgi:hypothetical protein